jgi:hypothetical protein
MRAISGGNALNTLGKSGRKKNANGEKTSKSVNKNEHISRVPYKGLVGKGIGFSPKG